MVVGGFGGKASAESSLSASAEDKVFLSAEVFVRWSVHGDHDDESDDDQKSDDPDDDEQGV